MRIGDIDSRLDLTDLHCSVLPCGNQRGVKHFLRPAGVLEVGYGNDRLAAGDHLDDIRSLADELVAKGIQLARSRESYTGPTGEIRSIYVRDPDGVLVQFNTP